jgi:hypothetical protein
MLVRGCPLCLVEIPPDFGKLATPKPTGFVSAFVYRDGTYVGSLDRYGTFLLRDEMAGSQDEREAKTETILFALEYSFGVISAVAALVLLLKIIGEKRRAKGLLRIS